MLISLDTKVAASKVYGLSSAMRLMKISAVCASLLMLAGCGPHVSATIDSQDSLPNPLNLSDAIAVYPLDPHKIYDLQYKTLSADFEADLARLAFKVDAPFDPSARYVAFIDYALEIGTDQPWAIYTTTIVYDTVTKQKVFQEDVEGESQSNDLLRIAGALLKQTAFDMLSGKSGERRKNVPMAK